jgi:hypothetical protein
MKLIAPFKEQFSVDYENDVSSIFDNMEVLSSSEVDTIVAYLSSCTLIDDWLSSVPDPINMSVKIPNRSWTDGVYYWDEMLIHFVSCYRVRLPDDFILHIQTESAKERSNLDLVKVNVEINKSLRASRQGDKSVYDMSYRKG